MMMRNDATERQVQAASPGDSTWLSANAGSGKTRVLTDRVARLLLNGVLPQHILCLTYTKAAASEMQNRLFKRLGAWAMKNDADLRAELVELGVDGKISKPELREARTLFARAIETPGGLKIQTIHSFCAALLRRFPLEAGVSPLFTEMEDRASALLRHDIVDQMAGGKDAQVVHDLARHFTGEYLDDLTAAIIRNAELFRGPTDLAKLHDAFGGDPSLDESGLEKSVFLGGEVALIADLITACRAGGVRDQAAADKLSMLSDLNLQALPILESVFLSGKGAKEPFTAKIGTFPTKKVQKDNASLMDRVEDLMRRVESARDPRLALNAVRRSEALHVFGHRFLQLYEHHKQQRGWLDFDDLILRARALLNDPTVAEWVLYRLDGGIDHILVDEAQDTSPAQWQVIERLAQEFTSGSGARSDVERTIFVVGDKKQSIYSFQGADPAEFDRMCQEFAARMQPSGHQLQRLSLEYSFRSSSAILGLVDTCFEGKHGAGFPRENKHRAFQHNMPGRVDLWPVVEPGEKSEKSDWFDPVDRLGETHHTVVLAERIADEIKRLIDAKETIPAQKLDSGMYSQRPVQAGDFLILVQRRSELFHEIIRACKSRDLPIAGADRLKVGGEMAVRDLAALLSFLSTPEDDLALATALRSPIFGWSEQMLFDLAHRRPKGFLWEELRKRREEFPKTLSIIDDLLSQTDFLRPYDLIERILTRHAARRNLLSRLGSEAEDGINALLSQALAYESSAVPSLTGFLLWMETDDLEIKRQMDSAGNRIRVMTVHGSKGLESPIVIMPDTAKRLVRTDAPIVPLQGQAAWNMPADLAPRNLLDARETMMNAQRAERLRLLYVAMTRAEKWLIVAAAGDLGKDGQSWYDIVRDGMTHIGAEPWQYAGGPGLRYALGDWSGPIVSSTTDATRAQTVLPDRFIRPAPEPQRPAPLFSPSDLGGAKALPGDLGQDEEQAKQYGTWIHLLLEHLPVAAKTEWPALARHLLKSDTAPIDPTVFDDLLSEASRVLETESFAHIFDPKTLAEVPITANLGAGRLSGIIDRLIIHPDRVIAVDFKSNRNVPGSPDQVPDSLLRQMGAYTHGLAQIFPQHRIETAILWTRTAQYMVLPHDLVTNALTASGYLDARPEAP
ncbi:double-strand break repair helicase AddA [Shimia sp.]|uniref:double-strand break repair helicase AddA n=1 Tax=Shimia sp. TaxID=1954381 RepID=UPI003297458D